MTDRSSPEVVSLDVQEVTVEAQGQDDDDCDEDREEVDDVLPMPPEDNDAASEQANAGAVEAPVSKAPAAPVVSLRALRPTRRDRTAVEDTAHQVATAQATMEAPPSKRSKVVDAVPGTAEASNVQLARLESSGDGTQQMEASHGAVVEGTTSAEVSQVAQPRRPLRSAGLPNGTENTNPNGSIDAPSTRASSRNATTLETKKTRRKQ